MACAAAVILAARPDALGRIPLRRPPPALARRVACRWTCCDRRSGARSRDWFLIDHFHRAGAALGCSQMSYGTAAAGLSGLAGACQTALFWLALVGYRVRRSIPATLAGGCDYRCARRRRRRSSLPACIQAANCCCTISFVQVARRRCGVRHVFRSGELSCLPVHSLDACTAGKGGRICSRSRRPHCGCKARY